MSRRSHLAKLARRVWIRLRRRVFLPIVLMAAAVAAAACGLDASVGSSIDTPARNPSATPAPSAAPSAPGGQGTQLPNGVPSPSGGLVVAGPDPAEQKGGVTGWSAVVVVSAASTPADVANWLRNQLLFLGWQEESRKGASPAADTRTIAVHRSLTAAPPSGSVTGTPLVGVTRQWLQVSVTDPLVGSGPAVSYRFAEAVS